MKATESPAAESVMLIPPPTYADAAFTLMVLVFTPDEFPAVPLQVNPPPSVRVIVPLDVAWTDTVASAAVIATFRVMFGDRPDSE